VTTALNNNGHPRTSTEVFPLFKSHALHATKRSWWPDTEEATSPRAFVDFVRGCDRGAAARGCLARRSRRACGPGRGNARSKFRAALTRLSTSSTPRRTSPARTTQIAGDLDLWIRLKPGRPAPVNQSTAIVHIGIRCACGVLGCHGTGGTTRTRRHEVGPSARTSQH
jgi:hypothetical protein